MLMLRKLTGNPVMFTEIFNLDYDTNTIGTGHAGPSNYLPAQSDDKVTITPDYELMDAIQISAVSGWSLSANPEK